jgi:hypothetical protein
MVSLSSYHHIQRLISQQHCLNHTPGVTVRHHPASASAPEPRRSPVTDTRTQILKPLYRRISPSTVPKLILTPEARVTLLPGGNSERAPSGRVTVHVSCE